MKHTPRTRTIPVRFDDETRTRIHRAAKRTGTNTSAIVRLSVLQQLTEIESGNIKLNPEPAGASR